MESLRYGRNGSIRPALTGFFHKHILYILPASPQLRREDEMSCQKKILTAGFRFKFHNCGFHGILSPFCPIEIWVCARSKRCSLPSIPRVLRDEVCCAEIARLASVEHQHVLSFRAHNRSGSSRCARKKCFQRHMSEHHETPC